MCCAMIVWGAVGWCGCCQPGTSAGSEFCISQPLRGKRVCPLATCLRLRPVGKPMNRIRGTACQQDPVLVGSCSGAALVTAAVCPMVHLRRPVLRVVLRAVVRSKEPLHPVAASSGWGVGGWRGSVEAAARLQSSKTEEEKMSGSRPYHTPSAATPCPRQAGTIRDRSLCTCTAPCAMGA